LPAGGSAAGIELMTMYPPEIRGVLRALIELADKAGSFRWSATKPKTTSAGASMTISPVILVMPGLTPARRDAG
jgi:hypothetical protein